MDTRVLDFLATQRVGVFAVTMPDGMVHAATVHFVYHDHVMLLLTSPASRKGSALSSTAVPASFVVGFSEDEMRTLQMDGEATVVDDPAYAATYFAKFPEKVGKFPGNIVVRFTPTWWRFSDFRAPRGPVILTSE